MDRYEEVAQYRIKPVGSVKIRYQPRCWRHRTKCFKFLYIPFQWFYHGKVVCSMLVVED